MATSRPARLLPPLHYVFRQAFADGDARKPLDLRDEAGQRVISGRRGMGRHPVDESIMRQEVTINLQGLFNAVRLEESEDFSQAPDAANSIINYGMPDLASLSFDDLKVNALSSEIRTAVLKYEPRIDPDSVKAERDWSVDPASLNLRFKVQAELLAEPLNLPVEFVAELDSEFGKIRVEKI